MMENIDNINSALKRKEWITPEIQIIPFRNTKGGDASYVEETLGGTVKTLS